ncbi:unnamed protein product [Caenorhabditis bovis]|uniref:Uncharacterized protein n=1 Tax=Caenorhabditis bovis TaxID=2654633 RepID=A0A8S1EKZ8_9PELO|nr:unnamed protein product [Caenorhabditis bovis]
MTQTEIEQKKKESLNALFKSQATTDKSQLNQKVSLSGQMDYTSSEYSIFSNPSYSDSHSNYRSTEKRKADWDDDEVSQAKVYKRF